MNDLAPQEQERALPCSITAASAASAGCDRFDDNCSIQNIDELRLLGHARVGPTTVSSIKRIHYDAMLPELNLPNRSWLRLVFDLIVGIPYLIMLWRLDALRVSLERFAWRFHGAAVGNSREKRWKKHEASE
jgi:hypothetical protein